MALDKAMGEAVRDAVAAGHSWADVGHALDLPAATSADQVLGAYVSARESSSRWFWGIDRGAE
jgi:hypothetical protein